MYFLEKVKATFEDAFCILKLGLYTIFLTIREVYVKPHPLRSGHPSPFKGEGKGSHLRAVKQCRAGVPPR